VSAELAGVVPIAVTPFDAAGRVDEASIATLVEFEARCGVHGLNVLGIMGEAHKLGEAERRRVAELFVKNAAGRLRSWSACRTAARAWRSSWRSMPRRSARRR
jgi:4-hydroxy-tetrahydrodipicolinate synthase